MVLSTEFVSRLFGERDQMGQWVGWDASHEYRLKGVIEVPDNTQATLVDEPSWRLMRFPV